MGKPTGKHNGKHERLETARKDDMSIYQQFERMKELEAEEKQVVSNPSRCICYTGVDVGEWGGLKDGEVVNSKINKATSEIYGKMELILSDAIEEQGFMLVDLNAIKENFYFRLEMNGDRILMFRDKPLVEFKKMEINQVGETGKFEFIQKYRKLEGSL